MALVRCWGCDVDTRDWESVAGGQVYSSGGPINNGRYYRQNTGAHSYYEWADTGSGIVEGGCSFWWLSEASNSGTYVAVRDDSTSICTIYQTQVSIIGQTNITGIPWTVDVWYYYQVEWKIHATTGYVRVYRRSQYEASRTLIAEYTDIDTTTTNDAVNKLDFYLAFLAMGWDDIIVWDNTGSLLTSALDTVLVVGTLRPSSDGAETDWTPNTGTNYDAVNDDSSDDADTTYVSSSTGGDRDRYGLTDTGIPPATVTIYGVQTGALARTLTSGTLKLGVRAEGGNESLSANQTVSTSYNGVYHTVELNPDDSSAWEAADLDGLELVLEHGT